MNKKYYVYIMTNKSRTLYTGVTKLIYYEIGDNINAAIAREKQIKGWLRAKKIALIESMNPNWEESSEGWDS